MRTLADERSWLGSDPGSVRGTGSRRNAGCLVRLLLAGSDDLAGSLPALLVEGVPQFPQVSPAGDADRDTSEVELDRHVQKHGQKEGFPQYGLRPQSAFVFEARPCRSQPCQKQPSTKTASLAEANTTSARRRKPAGTGRSIRKRRPRRWRARRSAISGAVSRRRCASMRRRAAALDASGAGVSAVTMAFVLATSMRFTCSQSRTLSKTRSVRTLYSRRTSPWGGALSAPPLFPCDRESASVLSR